MYPVGLRSIMEIEVLGVGIEFDETFIDEPPAAIERQITEYERGSREQFTLDVTYPPGFVGDVMRAMHAIPYGTTRTYGELAAQLDTAPVAVGQGCGRNPVPVVVPCHRVVAADGLGGYSAGGDRNLELKRGLLDLES